MESERLKQHLAVIETKGQLWQETAIAQQALFRNQELDFLRLQEALTQAANDAQNKWQMERVELHHQGVAVEMRMQSMGIQAEQREKTVGRRCVSLA